MSEPQQLPGALLAAQLLEAVKGGWAPRVRALLEQGADANATDPQGIRALFFACAGGHGQLKNLLFTPFQVELVRILPRTNVPAGYAEITRLLLERGAHPNERFPASGISPLMVAKYFRCDAAAELLLEFGARWQVRDAAGRSAERFTLFGTMARLIVFCARLPVVKSAYLADLHAPRTEEYTSPLVGLELEGPLPADAFAGWPADEPIVAFALADDAVSRLLALTPRVYDRDALANIYALAASLARLVNGQVHVLPNDADSIPIGVSLPGGSMPILLRDFGHTRSISLAGGGTFHPELGPAAAAILPQVAASAQAWAAQFPDKVSLVEAAVALIAVLSQELGEPWSASIPGTPEPSEMWLHGKSRAAASVGLFPGRAVLWMDGGSRSVSIGSRGALASAQSEIIAGVKAQQAAYASNQKLAERLRARAQELLRELSQRAPVPGASDWTCHDHGFTSHDHVESASIGYRLGRRRWEAAKVTAENGVISAHAGLFGDQGFRGSIESVPAAIDGIVRALQLSLVTLTVDTLVVGKRYEVILGLQGLVQGDVVEYRGLNDIDNHYGEYDFQNQDGKQVSVGGDCSSREGNPLRHVHLHLRAFSEHSEPPEMYFK